MTAAHYKGGHHPGNDLGLHYTALPPIVASCPYSDQLLVTRKFWGPGANRPSQASRAETRPCRRPDAEVQYVQPVDHHQRADPEPPAGAPGSLPPDPSPPLEASRVPA